jgi:hypothetical protein
MALFAFRSKSSMFENRTFAIIIFALSMVTHRSAYAGDAWFCKTQDTQVVGSLLRACGVSQDSSEATARAKAAEEAVKTARFFCEQTHRCSVMLDTADPGRLECENKDGTFHCYKYLEVSLLAHKEPSFFSRLFASTDEGKLKTGMSKDRVEQLFGPPAEASTAGTGVLIYSYVSDKFCIAKRCTVFFVGGQVTNYSYFKLSFAEPN